MPSSLTEWLLLTLVGMVARALFLLALMNAGPRHARYRLRVKLASWLLQGRLHDVHVRHVRKGKLVVPMSVRPARRGRPAQRGQVLSAVRRDDSSAGTA